MITKYLNKINPTNTSKKESGKNISRVCLETLLKSDKSTEEITNGQLGIKLENFIELDAILKNNQKLRSRKPRQNTF